MILKAPANHAIVSLQSSAQKAFIEQEPMRKAMDGGLTFTWYSLEKEGNDRTLPMPVSFAWEYGEGDAYCYLLISERKDMSRSLVYVTKAASYDVYNLKVGTKYFWCVQREGKRSEIFSFKTALTLPGFLKIDDVSNVRDIGAYEVAGGRIRQGLVYRGGEAR